MGGRLNPQSPELKWKDSIKKELKKQEKKTPALNCYGEKDLSLIELKGIKFKNLKELPYMERLGIAKWFKKHNKLSKDIIDFLFIDINHLNNTKIEAIDPIKKCYMTVKDIKELGITFETKAKFKSKVKSKKTKITTKVRKIKPLTNSPAPTFEQIERFANSVCNNREKKQSNN